MMSANLEFVHSLFAALERGDFSSAERAPGDRVRVRRWSISGQLAGMAEAWRDRLDAWEEFRVEVDEYRELDGELSSVSSSSARGRTSRLEFGQLRTQGATLCHVRDGKVTRMGYGS